MVSNIKQSPLVSITCLTYNHAPYLRQCLDGFVMQKTSFPIEILIYDNPLKCIIYEDCYNFHACLQ